jgi:cytochrome c biogenesis protein CcmG/thiol:disulfide interchange protein DsbE
MTTNSGSKKQIVLLAGLFLFTVLFVAGYVVKERQIGKKIITSGDQAAEFRLQALEGRSVKLSDLRGKVVMVHFWATWCPPCVEELPTIDTLYRTIADKDFQLLAVSVDDAAPEVVAFLKKHGLNLPVLMDPGRKTAGRYGTYKFPETYIVDRQGMVRVKVIGPRDWSRPENIQIVRDLLR